MPGAIDVKWLEFLERQWSRPIGVIAGILVTVGVLQMVLADAVDDRTRALSQLAASFLVALWWYRSRAVPRAKKGKVGFLICLDCEGDEERLRVREDLVRTLTELVKGGPTGQTFDVIVAPESVARRVQDLDGAREVQRRSGAKFVLWGRVRRRRLDGSDRHFITMQGIVAHRPVATEMSAKLSREFGELLPRKVSVDLENDLLSFDFLSAWIHHVARYVVGIAALISGDPDFAEALFREAAAGLAATAQEVPQLQAIKSRIPERLSEVAYIRASRDYHLWRQTKSPDAMARLGRHLEGISDKKVQHDAAGLAAIWRFVTSRDATQSIKDLQAKPQETDPSWHYNLAFLYGYSGDLRKAIRHYRAAAQLETPPDTLAQVEDFLPWMLELEPAKVQIHYLLGFFHWKIRGDRAQALDEFQRFLDAASGERLNRPGFSGDWFS